MPLNEVDTCRDYVLPKLYSAGWEDTQISEQGLDVRIARWSSAEKRAGYLQRKCWNFLMAPIESDNQFTP